MKNALIKQLGVALITGGLAVSASAANFFLDRGVDWGGDADGDSLTGDIAQLGYTGTLATSFYFGPVAPGTVVIDTNIGMAGVFASGSYTALDTVTSVSLSNTPTFGQKNINNLNPLTTGVDDTEGYGPGVASGYQFFYEYVIVGAINAAGTAVDFTSGFFNLFMVDNGAFGSPILGGARQVLKINVTGSALQLANQNIFGEVDYSWCDPVPGCSTEVQNLFNDSASGQSFFDIWSASVPPPVISFVLDTNVDPPIPTASQLVFFADCSAVSGVEGGCAVRQTTLDGSASFAVPEPATLALAGLGLLGMGVVNRRKSAKNGTV